MNDNAWSQSDADDSGPDPCTKCDGDGWIELGCGCCVEACPDCYYDDEDEK